MRASRNSKGHSFDNAFGKDREEPGLREAFRPRGKLGFYCIAAEAWGGRSAFSCVRTELQVSMQPLAVAEV